MNSFINMVKSGGLVSGYRPSPWGITHMLHCLVWQRSCPLSMGIPLLSVPVYQKPSLGGA